MVGTQHRAGVPFLAGTDSAPGVFIVPGFSLHDELSNFVEAGFTPMEALQTATSNPAKFFGIESSNGSIEPGKLADAVLLSANPLDDIHNTRKIAAVIANGHYYDRKALDSLLSQIEQPPAITDCCSRGRFTLARSTPPATLLPDRSPMRAAPVPRLPALRLHTERQSRIPAPKNRSRQIHTAVIARHDSPFLSK